MTIGNRLTPVALSLLALLITCFAGDTVHAAKPVHSRSLLTVDQWLAPIGGKLSFQVVARNAEGRRPIPGASLRLFGARDLKHSATADPSGFVSLENVEEGVYALVASKDSFFGYYALHVTESVKTGTLPSVGIVSCGNIGKAGFETAVSAYLPMEKHLDSVAVEDPPAAFEPITQGAVAFTVNGTLLGQVYVAGLVRQGDGLFAPAGSSNVFLYRNGRRVDHQRASADGRFQFRHVDPGTYTIVSVGPDGLGAVGVEVREQSTAADGRRFVAQFGGDTGFAMQVVPCCPAIATPCCEPAAEVIVEPVAAPAEIAAAPPVSAPAGPVGGGGGAVVSGGGFAGPAAAAAILAASTVDNGSPSQPPAAASPDH